MENLKLFTNGKVKTKDDREFTRLIGGFGEDKPMFLLWQSAELLGLKTSKVLENFERNEENFENGIDFNDLKFAIPQKDSDQTIDITEFLKGIGYSQNKLNATKRWLTFSFSGMMKLVKIATTKKSWDIYNDFLEDYFKIKAENKILKATLKEQIAFIKKEKATCLGMGFMEQNSQKKQEYFNHSEEITNRIIQLEKQLTEELTVEKYKVYEDKYKTFMDEEGCFNFQDSAKILSTKAEGENLHIKVNKISLPKLLRNNGVLSKVKKGKSYKNQPNSGYEKYFNTISTNIEVKDKNNETITISKTQTKITKNGLDYIYNLLTKKKKIA